LTVVLLMGVGPLIPWGRTDPDELLRQLAWPAAAAAATAVVLVGEGLRGTAPLLTFALAAFVTVSLAGQAARDGARERARTGRRRFAAAFAGVRGRRRYYGGMTVHLGVVMAAVAVAASSSYGSNRTVPLTVGQSVHVGGYTATLLRVDRVNTARRRSIVAVLDLRHGPSSVGRFRPALSTYPQSVQAVGTPAIRSTAAGDAYLTMTEVDPGAGRATIRLAVNPLVGWLWASSGVMALGGLAAAWPIRRRRPDRGPGFPLARHTELLEAAR